MNPPKAATAKKAEFGGGPSAETEELISGSEAIAHAVRLADVDVITAYPIRPYDTVMQYVSALGPTPASTSRRTAFTTPTWIRAAVAANANPSARWRIA